MATHTRGSSKRPAPPKEPPITLKDALDDDEPETAPLEAAPPVEIDAVAAALEAAEIEAVTAALEPVELALTPAEPAAIEAPAETAPEPVFDVAPEPALETVAEPVLEIIAEPVLEVVAKPITEAPVAPVTIIAATIEAAPAKAEPLDPSLWSLKTFDLVNENAAAVLDLALALGQARSVGDALEAQSRFASERYTTFLKRANELVELSSRWSPFRFAVSAFVA
ncbi:phasin family protein [Methylosinus sp. PW1]|uniref:phasin family protein n=1 Tax=Methylosinus sp. PW1 TaxID=107636 RepID=UPI00056CA909|nr:phasin family protein [Methylosinus sp. PW1]